MPHTEQKLSSLEREDPDKLPYLLASWHKDTYAYNIRVVIDVLFLCSRSALGSRSEDDPKKMNEQIRTVALRLFNDMVLLFAMKKKKNTKILNIC